MSYMDHGVGGVLNRLWRVLLSLFSLSSQWTSIWRLKATHRISTRSHDALIFDLCDMGDVWIRLQNTFCTNTFKEKGCGVCRCSLVDRNACSKQWFQVWGNQRIGLKRYRQILGDILQLKRKETEEHFCRLLTGADLFCGVSTSCNVANAFWGVIS